MLPCPLIEPCVLDSIARICKHNPKTPNNFHTKRYLLSPTNPDNEQIQLLQFHLDNLIIPNGKSVSRVIPTTSQEFPRRVSMCNKKTNLANHLVYHLADLWDQKRLVRLGSWIVRGWHPVGWLRKSPGPGESNLNHCCHCCSWLNLHVLILQDMSFSYSKFGDNRRNQVV